MVVICSARLARRPVGPSPLHAARVAETALLAAAGCGETLFPLDEGWL
jgi:hypothetical protein